MLTVFLVLGIFLLRLPPFGNTIFHTHNVGRLIILCLFCLSIFRKKKQVIKSLDFIVLYFIFVSFSITLSVSITDYIGEYKDLAVGIALYYSYSRFYTKVSERVLISSLLVSVVVNTFINLTFYIQIEPIYSFLVHNLYQKYFTLIDLNASRDRFFIENIDFFIFPFLFSLFFSRKTGYVKKTLLMLFIGLLLFQFMISGFRSLLVLGLLAIIIPLLITKNVRLKLALLFISILAPLVLLVYSTPYFHNNSINRVINPQEQDVRSATSRLSLLKNAFDIFKSSPLNGIGFGNIIYYSEAKLSEKYNNPLYKYTYIHPHNILFELLAEVGVMGLLSYLIMMGYFLFTDLYRNKHSTYLKIGFWMLFLSSLVNPSSVIQFQSTFWVLRSLIDAQSNTNN